MKKTNILCEVAKCGTVVGENIFNDSGNPQGKKFFSNSKICPNCKAEFCDKCFAKMITCYCCGKNIGGK